MRQAFLAAGLLALTGCVAPGSSPSYEYSQYGQSAAGGYASGNAYYQRPGAYYYQRPVMTRQQCRDIVSEHLNNVVLPPTQMASMRATLEAELGCSQRPDSSTGAGARQSTFRF